jgi:hypothetical protein
MRGFWLVGVLIAAFAWTQIHSAAPAAPTISSASGEQDKNGHEAAPADDVAPDAPVITIKGLCAAPPANPVAPAAACETVITRAQFDELADVLHMAKGSETWHQLANSYPQILVMAQEAEHRGVEKQPRFQERLRFARLQILSQELIRQLREESARVPDKDIADYYQEHSKEFEQVSLERIVIPNQPQRDLKPGEQGAERGNTTEDAMTKEAELLRTRAAQGESFTKLQKEAYDFAGLSGDSEPNPSLGKMRRRGLPLTHASVFDLKPGEVSPVISDTTGHYIYKLDAKEIAPLESVKQEISGTLRQQRTENVVQAIQRPFTTDINPKYFGRE